MITLWRKHNCCLDLSECNECCWSHMEGVRVEVHWVGPHASTSILACGRRVLVTGRGSVDTCFTSSTKHFSVTSCVISSGKHTIKTWFQWNVNCLTWLTSCLTPNSKALPQKTSQSSPYTPILVLQRLSAPASSCCHWVYHWTPECKCFQAGTLKGSLADSTVYFWLTPTSG